MERQIIRIDEATCDGCGQCAQGCPEGALQIIEGKARLVSEITCDGLGACVGDCPRGAITVETRDAAPYDERKTLDTLLPLGAATLKAHLAHLHHHGQTAYLREAEACLAERGVPVPDYRGHGGHGCPGSAPREIRREAAPAPAQGLVSQLTQWPVQMHLVSPSTPVFRKADLLLAADCTAFAMADFNQAWLPGRKLAIACPKLDSNQESYVQKLRAFMDEAEVNTITVMIMEVPCCGGLLRAAQIAAQGATRRVPIKVVVVGVDGEVRREQWIA